MAKVDTLLSERLKKSENSTKIASLAKHSAEGNLTTFAGLFNMAELSSYEKQVLETILREHGDSPECLQEDLKALIAITTEVKAINNQAALLHGERIKKAQAILKTYQEGAFSSWLMATYGNRQTPYNFLQYYEFYEALPKAIRSKIELLPRQAVYTLASREGDLNKKIALIESFMGQTKEELLQIIRDQFPLDEKDQRRQNHAESAIQALRKAISLLAKPKAMIDTDAKEEIEELLFNLQGLLKKKVK